MTAQVIQIKPPTVHALVNQTKAAWDRADLKREDADDWYIRTGRLLIALKAKVREEGGRWLPTLKKVGRSQRRAHELMELAGGEVTIEQQRERKRKSMRKSRKKKKSAPRGAETAAAEEAVNTDEQLEERWQNSAANFFGDVIAMQAYWDKNFEGWKQFEVPSHIKTLAREAATAFAALAAKVIRR